MLEIRSDKWLVVVSPGLLTVAHKGIVVQAWVSTPLWSVTLGLDGLVLSAGRFNLGVMW